MSFLVQREVVGAGEGLVTDLTHIRFVSRVLAVVTPKLIGTRESPVAFRPLAAERLFTCKNSQKVKKVKVEYSSL